MLGTTFNREIFHKFIEQIGSNEIGFNACYRKAGFPQDEKIKIAGLHDRILLLQNSLAGNRPARLPPGCPDGERINYVCQDQQSDVSRETSLNVRFHPDKVQ